MEMIDQPPAYAAHGAAREAEEASNFLRLPRFATPPVTASLLSPPKRERSGPKAAPLLLLVSEYLLHALEDGGDAHAPADTEGDETVAAAHACEVVQDLHGQDGAGSPDRVSERDRPAHGV